MNEKEALVIAKVAMGNRELTAELGINFCLALEPYSYEQATAALAILLRQERITPPEPKHIIAQIKIDTNSVNPARKFFTAKENAPDIDTPLERRRAICAAARAAKPDLFEDTRKRRAIEPRGFDEGCSD